MDQSAVHDSDNDSGLSVTVAEALAGLQTAREHGEAANRIFRNIQDEQHAMMSNWNGSSHASYMSAAMSYNDDADEITRGLFNFISTAEDGISKLNSHDDV